MKSAADKARILLMDDEEMIRAMAGRMLNCLGYRVEVASTGSEAIRLYRDATLEGNPFAVVILDLENAVGLGGEATIKKLIDMDPAVKAILTTGSHNDPVFYNYIKHGFNAVLPKPFSMKELRETLERTLLREAVNYLEFTHGDS